VGAFHCLHTQGLPFRLIILNLVCPPSESIIIEKPFPKAHSYITCIYGLHAHERS